MKHSATPFASLVAFLSLVTIDLTPAAAATAADSHAITVAGSQRALSQKMYKHLLLAALGVDKAGNLEHLAANRRQFGETQAAQRSGDPAPGPEVLQALSAVDELWLLFDTVVGNGLNAGKGVTADLVARVDSLDLPLLAATDKVVQSYEKAAAGLTFSMLAVTVNVAARQRMLSQKIAKEVLLIAYGHEAERNRRNLKQSADEFDATLKALIRGDAERLLMVPPTLKIRTQLAQVERHWQDFLSRITLVAEGAKVDAGLIEFVARENPPLVEAVSQAVTMYQAL